MPYSRHAAVGGISLGAAALAVVIWASPSSSQEAKNPPKAPAKAGKADHALVGDPVSGRDVFRFETFGNEGFWTDAMRLPQGMKKEKVTPLMLLETGFHIDADALPADLRTALGAEFKTDHSAAKAPTLNDPAATMKIVEANALIGVVPKNGKVGIACAICHTITDGSVLQMDGKGSVGKRLDGRATHSLDMGTALAIAENSRAYYPNLQLELGGKTIGRAPKGLRKDSTEEEVDAYLKNPAFYPRGTFDETQDGIGNPVQNTPLFRQDLAGPYGTAGEFDVLDHISNASYTTNLDPTTLVTPEGREFLKAKANELGEELSDNYAAILKETGVTGFPFVKATTGHKVGDLASPVGRKVDMQKVADMGAYIKALPAPPGMKGDAAAVARGKNLFRANCATCHNEDQSKPVPATLVDLKDLWPAYKPETLAERKKPLSPVVNSPGGFDDKMVVIDASDRMEKRGNALPLLLDLARKPVFLHDASVKGLDALLDPKRGADAPHPVYLKEAGQRGDMVAFLKSLDTRAPDGAKETDPPAKAAETPSIKVPAPAPRSLPQIPKPDPAAAEVPAGYRVDVIMTDLQYPSSIEFDDRGAVYVAEAGNIDGDWVAPARVIKYTQVDATTRTNEVVADNLMGPVTDLLWHQGKLFISHRGKISVIEAGKVKDLVTDLPSFGDHHNNQMTAGPDGKIYFGQGSATNSGVVGVDNYLLGWLAPYPDFSDRPGKDVTLRGQAFESADPLTALAKNKARMVKTSAYQAFGKTVAADTTVKGTAKATAAVLRMDADGKNLEVYAWGLRNPFGVMWGPDGKLYASDNGADERGVRPVANCPDNLWEIKKDAWYGWPDFVSGEPVTADKFKPKGMPAPEFLMKDHPKVETPLMTFEPHASVCKIDFSRGRGFGFEGQMFLAASGDYAPATAAEQKRAGYWVKRVDPATGTAETFFRAKPSALGPKDMEYVLTAGPKRPVDVKFSPAGDALYIVDIGAVAFVTSGQGPTPRPFPGTGVVWRVTRQGAGR